MTSRFIAALFLCLVLLPGIALAGKPKLPPPPDDRKLVSAIDVAKNTMEITHQSHKITTKYVFAPGAVIVINDKPSAIKNIRVGLQLFSIKLDSGMQEPSVIEELYLKSAAPAPK